ncbi:hypothetical protein ACLX1H_002178 [Fusarium chlamydosporum]
MYPFLSQAISAYGFKIHMPLSNEEDAERYICRLNIMDLNRWRYELTPKKRAGKVDRVDQTTSANNGKWALTNSSFPVDETLDEKDKRAPESPASSTSSDSPKYTMEELRLLMPGEKEDHINAKTIADRMQAHLILEGKLTPPPCRNYEGPLAPCFRAMAIAEEREVHRRAVLTKMKRTLQARLAEDGLKGWEFLHSIIYEGQSSLWGTRRFPKYHPNQRAYLLTRDFKDGKYIVSSIRNLSACSQREVIRLVSRIEERGWQDMIYVTNQGEDIPYCFENEVPEYLDWYGPSRR